MLMQTLELGLLEMDANPQTLADGEMGPRDRVADDDTPGGSEAAEDDHAAFVTQLLCALAAMAVRSKRRQADLSAALKRSGLQATAQGVMSALRQLEQQGCIEDLVPLYDGGVLMSVTSRGIEHLSAGPRWTMLDGPPFRMT